MTIPLLLLVLALVAFLGATFGAVIPRINLVAAGLALWVLSLLLRS